jgi:mono/diheme cytochrome c family protein
MLFRLAQLASIVAGVLLAVGIAEADTGDVHNGKLVYERNCMACHGPQGDGHGEAAQYMSTKPRDYRDGHLQMAQHTVRFAAARFRPRTHSAQRAPRHLHAVLAVTR